MLRHVHVVCMCLVLAVFTAHRLKKDNSGSITSVNDFTLPQQVQKREGVTITLAPGTQVTFAPNSCGRNLFACNNGDCIPSKWTCDGDSDCNDHSDERLAECPPSGECSGSHRFLCNNNKCVAIDVRCDGDNDCGDDSDEQGCAQFQCNEGEWKCANNVLCVTQSVLCDGHDDCGDRSDEHPINCNRATLEPHLVG